jgi:hypothetical protein
MVVEDIKRIVVECILLYSVLLCCRWIEVKG